MSELAIRLGLLLLWAALVSLDERACGSFMIHQPLVAGSVAGAIMGNLPGGLAAGLVFQCLWPGLLPVGGVLLPSSGLAGVTAGAVTAWGGHLVGTRLLWTGDAPLALGAVLGVVAAWAGQTWERSTRQRNQSREERALASPDPLAVSLGRALRGAQLEGALRGVSVVGAAVALAGVVYLWPAGLREMGRPLWVQLGWSFPLAALGLGLGSLAFVLRGARRWPASEILWGLLAGAAFQLFRRL